MKRIIQDWAGVNNIIRHRRIGAAKWMECERLYLGCMQFSRKCKSTCSRTTCKGNFTVVTRSGNGVGILKNRFNVYMYKCTSSRWAGRANSGLNRIQIQRSFNLAELATRVRGNTRSNEPKPEAGPDYTQIVLLPQR
jgi:hypothetical protein